MTTCAQCKKQVHPLDVFSNGECLACHEKNYKDDGINPLEMLTKSITQ